MSGRTPAPYKAEDKSLLLPFYRRFLVDPLLPFVPRSVHPNTITHAGQLINLTGTAILLALWPKSGWPFVVAAVLLQVYVWCDNADGAHARRTGQTSAYGELLDHGLDILNTVYIGWLTAYALGAPPLWWVVIALIIPGAGGITYWEQSETGVFRLGMINQVESCLMLSTALVAGGIWSTGAFESIGLGGVTLRLALLCWCLATILFGMVRGMVRVAQQKGLARVAPVLACFAFGVAVCGAAATGAVSTIAAVGVATAYQLAFSSKMLVQRLRGETARVEPLLVIATAAFGGLAGWRLLGRPMDAALGLGAATVISALFGVQALSNARDALAALERARDGRAAPIPAIEARLE